jgi:uncharacterized protein (UPF0332 family)
MALTDEEKASLIKYRLDKSYSILIEADDVANLGHWNLTVNRLYYAAFHACNALLLDNGLSARTHSGLIGLIGQNFIRANILSTEDGRLISNLFSMRQTGDYNDMFDWSESQVKPLIEPTRALVNKIKSIISKH